MASLSRAHAVQRARRSPWPGPLASGGFLAQARPSFTTDDDEATVTHFVDGMAKRDLPPYVSHLVFLERVPLGGGTAGRRAWAPTERRRRSVGVDFTNPEAGCWYADKLRPTWNAGPPLSRWPKACAMASRSVPPALGSGATTSADVYKRCCAFGLLSSHSRLHGSSSYRVPWLFDEEGISGPTASDVLRSFTKLKCRLMP